MPRITHPDDGVVYACPECDVAGGVYRRTHENKEFDKPFRCGKCREEFEEPVERPPKDTSNGATDPDGLPAQLNDRAKELIRSSRGS